MPLHFARSCNGHGAVECTNGLMAQIPGRGQPVRNRIFYSLCSSSSSGMPSARCTCCACSSVSGCFSAHAMMASASKRSCRLCCFFVVRIADALHLCDCRGREQALVAHLELGRSGLAVDARFGPWFAPEIVVSPNRDLDDPPHGYSLPPQVAAGADASDLV
jgi:hypothetical protein